MESIYKISGISRQGYFQQNLKLEKEIFVRQRAIEMVKSVRKNHPKMGARTMYYMLKIQELGINKFERLVSISGLGIKQNRLWIKTTNSNHNLYKYNNLTNGLKLTGINQLWVSDITYWIIGEVVFYLVFIQDVYSRRILGYSASDNMYTANNIKALKMAFKTRQDNYFEGLIHHSDKGSQYCSNEYISLLKQANIKISMANNSLENPYVERLNGIIKNDYLAFKNADTLCKVKKALDDIVKRYNNEKPHSELNYLTPIEYERKLKDVPVNERLIMTLYDFNNKKNN
jgi:transposase InsO family protein